MKFASASTSHTAQRPVVGAWARFSAFRAAAMSLSLDGVWPAVPTRRNTSLYRFSPSELIFSAMAMAAGSTKTRFRSSMHVAVSMAEALASTVAM